MTANQTTNKKYAAINLLKELVQMVATEHDDFIIQAIDEITLLEDYDSAITTLEIAIGDLQG